MVHFNCILDDLCVGVHIWPPYFRAKLIFFISVPNISVRRAFELINDALIFITFLLLLLLLLLFRL